jgi:phosphate transport system permease protein
VTTAASSLTRRRAPIERVVELGLFAAAGLGVVTTIGILIVLLAETVDFFNFVNPLDFFFGTQWSASIAPYRFGVLALVSGTLLVAAISVVIAVPLGLLSAVLLAEYTSTRVRNLIKPLLETIAGIPTIVLGFFGLYFLTPNLIQPLLGAENVGTFNALSGGIVVGLLITPLIASISEDAMRAVPRGLREAAFAMGATRFEVVRKVVIPAALSGIMASIILAISRAVGETMAVVLTVGTRPQLTFNPLESVQTMTAFIIQISLGDTPQGSIQFKALFAVAATLFGLTLVLNLISNRVVARFRTGY